MCGIAGIISNDPGNIDNPKLQQMATSMSHRGPDAATSWINSEHTVGLAHTRLSIIDTSRRAGQPMHYLDRYTIVYNGEIYNYREIRQKLSDAGVTSITASDTEVVLLAYVKFGVACLDLFDGMFAFAIWDDDQRQLFCARDRFGEKPFYFYQPAARNAFYFGSSLDSLYSSGIDRVVNESMLLSYVALGNTNKGTDTSVSFDRHIRKLQPSHYLLYSLSDNVVRTVRYWDITRRTSKIVVNDAAARLMELLTLSIQRRLRSDVSVGMNLSGGLDSSSIAAILARLGMQGFPAFTAIFPGFEKNEQEPSQSLAATFDLNQHFVRPEGDLLADELVKLIRYQEEPFTSASVYAQFKVFEKAKQENITVLLDGQGADETVAGYDKYRSWRLRSLLPHFTSGLLEAKDKRKLSANAYLNSDYLMEYGNDCGINKPVVRDLRDLLYYNIYGGDLEELLRYADRNSMAFGREVRLPFLFHELVDFVFSLPSDYLVGKGHTKFLLRHAMRTHLPARITERKKKTGFEPPQKAWMLNNRLKDLMADSRSVLVYHGILNGKALKKELVAHDAYDRDTEEWRWLIAGQWLKCNKKGV